MYVSYSTIMNIKISQVINDILNFKVYFTFSKSCDYCLRAFEITDLGISKYLMKSLAVSLPVGLFAISVFIIV